MKKDPFRVPEETFHQFVAHVLEWQMTGPDCDWTWTTFPLGGGGKIRGAKLQRAGVRKGWPDTQFLRGGRFYAIELKGDGGRVSDDQEETQSAIIRAGGLVENCWTGQAVLDTLDDWGFPLIERDWDKALAHGTVHARKMRT